MEFGFDYQYPSTCRKMFKSERPLKSYKK